MAEGTGTPEKLIISPDKPKLTPSEKNQLRKDYFAMRQIHKESYKRAGAKVGRHEPISIGTSPDNKDSVRTFWKNQRAPARKEISVAAAKEFRAKQESKRKEAALRGALIDSLTGLDSRNLWEIKLNEAVLEQKRQLRAIKEGQVKNPEEERRKMASIIIIADLNGLKEINDSGGHQAGDAILNALGTIVRKIIRSTDEAARLGGDEFAFLLKGTDKKGVKILWNKINDALLSWGNNGIKISAGMVALDPYNPAVSIRRADAAMYIAKDRYYDTESIKNNLEDGDKLSKDEISASLKTTRTRRK